MSLVKGWHLLLLCLIVFVAFSESQVQSLAFTLSLFANRKQPVIDESDDTKIPPPKPDLADLLSRSNLPPINNDKPVPMTDDMPTDIEDDGEKAPEIMSEAPIIEDAKPDDEIEQESEIRDDNPKEMRSRINDMLRKRNEPPQEMQEPPSQKRDDEAEKVDDSTIDTEDAKSRINDILNGRMQQPPMRNGAKVNDEKEREKLEDVSTDKQVDEELKINDEEAKDKNKASEEFVEVEVETDGNVHERQEYDDYDPEHYRKEVEEFKKYDPEDDEVEDYEYPNDDDDEDDDAYEQNETMDDKKEKQNDDKYEEDIEEVTEKNVLNEKEIDESLEDKSGYLEAILDGMDVLFDALRKFKTRNVVLDESLNESDVVQLYKECSLKLDKLEKAHSASSTVEIDASNRILNTFIFVFADVMLCLLCYPRKSSILAFTWTLCWMWLALTSYLMNESSPLFIVLGVNAIFPLLTQTS